MIQAIETDSWNPTERATSHRYWEYEVTEAIEKALGRKDTYLQVYQAYCGSMDAALSLHKTLIPGWAILDMSLNGFAKLGKGLFGPVEQGVADTTARAWLIAILYAYLEDQNEA